MRYRVHKDGFLQTWVYPDTKIKGTVFDKSEPAVLFAEHLKLKHPKSRITVEINNYSEVALDVHKTD